jgi:putative drug exporter of the RND superfamily
VVDATDNRTASFLPAEAESTEALLLQEQRFPGGDSVTGLIVYRRPGGLTDADRAEIEADTEVFGDLDDQEDFSVQRPVSQRTSNAR